MALYTRAWENVVGILLTNPAEAGGSQGYLGVKDTAAGIGLTLLAPTPPGIGTYSATFDIDGKSAPPPPPLLSFFLPTCL